MNDADLIRELASRLAPIEEAEDLNLVNPSFVVMAFAQSDEEPVKYFSCALLLSNDIEDDEDEQLVMDKAPAPAVAAMYIHMHSESPMTHALKTADAIKNHLAAGEEEGKRIITND